MRKTLWKSHSFYLCSKRIQMVKDVDDKASYLERGDEETNLVFMTMD